LANLKWGSQFGGPSALSQRVEPEGRWTDETAIRGQTHVKRGKKGVSWKGGGIAGGRHRGRDHPASANGEVTRPYLKKGANITTERK